jgi:protein gp37
MSTKIQWTDDTWNPVSGCTRIAEGCRNCYAERLTATRLRQHPRYKGLAVMQPGGPRWSGEVRTHPEVLREPLRWRKPKKVFVCDMSDLFHESVPFDFVDQVFWSWPCARTSRFRC